MLQRMLSIRSLVLGLVLISPGATQTQSDGRSHQRSIDDEQEAIAAADTLTGFGSLPASSLQAAHATLGRNSGACRLPFLRFQGDSAAQWQVSYSAVSWKVAQGPDSVQLPPRDFIVTLDSAGGHLVCVWSVREDLNRWPYIQPRPDSESEEGMNRAGWRYTGFPDTLPVPLVAALQHSPSPVDEARELEAICVMVQTLQDSLPQPRWYVTLRGIPPIDPFGTAGDVGDQVPIDQRTSTHMAFDARTGEFLAQSYPAR